MKRSTLILTLLLPAVCAATAAAQFSTIRFTAPVNPIAGLPMMLPSPIIGPLAGTGISLPTPVPSLTPAFTVAPAAAAVELPMSVLPEFLPAHGEKGPQVHPGASDVVVIPLTQVEAGTAIRFAGAESSATPAPAETDGGKQKLDETFDGEGRPAKPAVNLPRRAPVTSGRRIRLPEDDLMRELGY